jgi:fused signal recognition particle receptor
MNSIFSKLKQTFINTSTKISAGIDQIFLKKKLDNQTLNELEELLISADLGSLVASQLVASLKSIKFDKEVTSDVIKNTLAGLINNILLELDEQLSLFNNKLNVILVCGVNGNGKTTTIGKLAHYYKNCGKKIAIAACDTFRAASVEQLESWAQKSEALLISGDKSADPASVAYRAVLDSIKNNVDILLIDTAGRLHNQKNLMDELSKIIKVIKKIDDSAPHHSILVIDATTGQNAYNQVEQFKSFANISGLIVTKLDGTAKAGVLVGIAKKFHLPIYFIGLGEKIDDLKPFNSRIFAKAIVGLDNLG